MLKINAILSTIFLLSLAIILITSCKKDPVMDPTTPSLIGPESININGVMMTLSAISYTNDGESESAIRASIISYLNDTSLATHGNWQLTWGPGISGWKSNMVFVASIKTTIGPIYVITIRGTNTTSIPDVIQDLDVFVRVHFPYGEPGDSVARGAMNGLDSLLSTKDAGTHKTLEEYLTALPMGKNISLFVTGHSQGGGLAPLMAYWLVKNQNLANRFEFHTVAFAGPGVVNQNFATNFINALPPTGSFKMKVNSKDGIPWSWASLPAMLEKGIPVHVPFPQSAFYQTVHDSLQAMGITYVNVVHADSIGYIPITDSGPGGITPADSIKWYDHWLATEHNHNNYLKLLGVKPLPEK